MNIKQEKILSEEQVRFLKKSAHHLNPVVQIGKNGLSPSVKSEIEAAIEHHELIKIQILPVQKGEMDAIVVELTANGAMTHVATIGKVVILFRQKEKDSAFFA